MSAATDAAVEAGETTTELRKAIGQALDEELTRDERVVFYGQDVATAGGVFAVTPGLSERHGDRVFDTPISEMAMAGAAFGAAITGLRPVVEIMFGDFLPLAMDSLLNQATKHWYVSNGQGSVPLVIRSVVGGGGRFGAIHSQMPIAWFHSIPGLKIAAPSNPADARGLLKAAIRDDNPVVFFEHKRLYSLKGPGGDGEPVPLGSAAVVREGADVTIVTVMKGVHDALAAADMLAGEGIAAEVIDVRTIRPLDWPTIERSLVKTNRLIVLEEGPLTGGWAGEVLALALERAVEHIDHASRIATPNTPVPYSPPLEDDHFPGAKRIASLIKERI